MKLEMSLSTKKAWLVIDQLEFTIRSSKGFSLTEVLLASTVFGLLVTAFVGAYLYGQESMMLAGNRARAALLAEEGLEAIRNIRDAGFSNLTDGTYGLAIAGSRWTLSGTSDTIDIFTRQVIIASIDPKRKSVTANVAWRQNPQRNGLVSLVSRFTNWQNSALPPADCNDYAISLGYNAGTCRANIVQCNNNGETYEPGGDIFCNGGASSDTCCALP